MHISVGKIRARADLARACLDLLSRAPVDWAAYAHTVTDLFPQSGGTDVDSAPQQQPPPPPQQQQPSAAVRELFARRREQLLLCLPGAGAGNGSGGGASELLRRVGAVLAENPREAALQVVDRALRRQERRLGLVNHLFVRKLEAALQPLPQPQDADLPTSLTHRQPLFGTEGTL
ncbi:hypothetical protein GPECTOR_69g423 [Gonium pectorale]|uniref:Uncharacterized protein n=1 Tax=Gonium pectorale TaxID=33097 RepID=A0A150G4U3_GONPE|nr:hypothetical protein GPECTOR_69g423 [Gonium pectorale]|eukprot:KXZ44330.1 hypothetical protein GPECTOR_69g423 [Gonium pectorale]